MSSLRARTLAVVAALIVVALAGCSDQEDGSLGSDKPLTVLAASSLAGVLPELGEAFTATDAEFVLRPRYGGSSALARQVADGAPADLLITADWVALDRVSGQVEAPALVARNRLEIAVAAGNPASISGLDDLSRGGIRVVVCAPEVPCGRLAARALKRAGVRLRPASLEQDVRAVAAKVSLGEADAGIVYATEVRAGRPGIEGVAVSGASNPDIQAEYFGAAVKASMRKDRASAFLAFLQSPVARGILSRHGFVSP